MRTVYAAVLEVRTDEDVSASLGYVRRWIHDWYLRQRIPVDVFKNLDEGDLAITPAEGHRLSFRNNTSKTSSGDSLIDIRWEYPDQYDKSLGWVVTLALLRCNAELLLSLEVAVVGLQLVIAPAIIKLGSPRVIRDIARLRSVRVGGYPYNLTPELVSADDIELLVSELTDANRPYPIVLVTRRIQDDTPLVDANDLADRLAGVAKVYELADKWSAFRLTEELGKALSCYAGAVRLYWPRFNTESDPFAYPVWMPWQFKDATTVERSLEHLSRMVFEAAAYRHIEPTPIAHVRASAEREAREAARSVSTKSTDELLDDLIEMESKLKAAEDANAVLAKDNKTLRDNAAAYASHLSWQGQTSTAEVMVAEGAPENTAPTSITEAVRLAQARAKSVRFLPSAYASAQESPYKQPERVLQALYALEEVASIWAKTVGSGKAGGSVRQLFKARGFEYADDVSQTSKGKWGAEYVADYEGQQVDISPHITLGAKQADTCLSIHWAWLKEEKIALVAHVGRHKTNTKT